MVAIEDFLEWIQVLCGAGMVRGPSQFPVVSQFPAGYVIKKVDLSLSSQASLPPPQPPQTKLLLPIQMNLATTPNKTVATNPNESAEDLLWHRRFGHMNYDYIRRILFPGKGKQPLSESHQHRCEVCILSKQTRAPHRKTPAKRATHPF